MSTFKFSCPSCGGSIEASPEHAGSSSHCPHCQKPLVVPLFPEGPPEQKVQRSRPTSAHRGNRKRLVLVLAGVAAVAVVAGVLAFALDLLPMRGGSLGHAASSRNLGSSSSGDIEVSGTADHETGRFEEFDPRLLPVQPLSTYRENKYWQEFFGSPEKVVQLVNYDIDLRTLTNGGGDWISPQEPSLERHSFLMGFSFVQRVAPRNQGDRESGDVSTKFKKELKNDFGRKRWEEWLARLDLNGLDEFERRDLIESEQAAVAEILSKLPYDTKFKVVSDWICRLKEYDFDRQIFPLATVPYPDIDFGEVEIRSRQQELLHVSEEDARELRESGVTHLCIRRTFQREWGGMWFPFQDTPDSISLSPVNTTALPLPDEWSLSAPGNDMLALRKTGDSGKPSEETFNAFSEMLREYHEDYMAHAAAHYRPFSVFIQLKQTGANTYLEAISRLQQQRDSVGLEDVAKKLIQLEIQTALIAPSGNLKALCNSYVEGSASGIVFMQAKDPPYALDFLEPWLNSHLEMTERRDAILAEIEKLKAE